MSASGPTLSTSELLKRGGLATGLAAVANLIIYYLAEAVLAVPPVFQPFHPARVAGLTILGGLLAIGAYAIVQKQADDPPRRFVTVAIIALLVSFIPDVLLLVTDQPGATLAGVVTLMIMHTVAAVIIVAGLTMGNLGQARPIPPHAR